MVRTGAKKPYKEERKKKKEGELKKDEEEEFFTNFLYVLVYLSLEPQNGLLCLS